MYPILEHPEIGYALRTGYPSCIQEGHTTEEYDEDAAYDERRDEYGW